VSQLSDLTLWYCQAEARLYKGSHHFVLQSLLYLVALIFQFAGLGGLFSGAKPNKDPRGDGTVLVMEAFSLY